MKKVVFKTAKDTLMSLVEKCRDGITDKELKSTSVSNIGKSVDEVKQKCEETNAYIKEYASIKGSQKVLQAAEADHRELLASRKVSNLCTTLSSLLKHTNEIISKEVEERKTGKVQE